MNKDDLKKALSLLNIETTDGRIKKSFAGCFIANCRHRRYQFILTGWNWPGKGAFVEATAQPARSQPVAGGKKNVFLHQVAIVFQAVAGILYGADNETCGPLDKPVSPQTF